MSQEARIAVNRGTSYFGVFGTTYLGLDTVSNGAGRPPGRGVWSALWRELQVRGHAGGISIIRDFLRPKRALRASGRATVRSETEPGRQLETDWAVQRTVIAGQPVEVHVAVSTLGKSGYPLALRRGS